MISESQIFHFLTAYHYRNSVSARFVLLSDSSASKLEKELEELNSQQEEDEIRKDEEEKKKVQDENDRQSVILEMIGGLKPPSGSRARSVPRGRRREKVAAEVSGKRELILDDSFFR